ncbi:MAG: hypothetical protein IPF41_05360 [Flavobacteriales bacterium]|nr:hypothetical protein [Flavobacteriales bacterium]
MTHPLTEVGISNSASPAHNTDWLRIATVAHLAITTVLLIMSIARCVTAFCAVASASNEALPFLYHIPASATEHHAALMAHEHARRIARAFIRCAPLEAAAALFWSNPAYRLALRELRLVHELEADSIARMSHPHYEALVARPSIQKAHALLLNCSTKQPQTPHDHVEEHPFLRLAESSCLASRCFAFAVALSSWQAALATIASIRGEDPFLNRPTTGIPCGQEASTRLHGRISLTLLPRRATAWKARCSGNAP